MPMQVLRPSRHGLVGDPPWSCHVEVFNPSRGLTVPLGYGASVTGNLFGRDGPKASSA